MKTLVLKPINEDSALELEIIKIINNESVDAHCVDEWLKDLSVGGCSSGMVHSLLYYADTTAFFNKHREEINSFLSEYMDDCGFSCLSKMFSNWDNDDPLIIDIHNSNLVVWFVFEEIARRIGEENGIEL